MEKILIELTINSVLILVAGVLGLIVNRKMKKKQALEVLSIIALVAVVLGLSMALNSENILIAMLCLVVGYFIGDYFELDKKISSLIGVKNIFDIKLREEPNLFSGLFLSSMISLIGPLAIIGSMELGINQKMNILILKSGFDFIATFVLASSLGKGVLLSVVPIFIFQSLFALLGRLLGNTITDELLNEIFATGGLILVSMGLTILGIRKFKIISLLVGLLFVPIVYFLFINIGLI
jgi:hypothetical protein